MAYENMHGQTRGRSPCKLGIRRKIEEQLQKSHMSIQQNVTMTSKPVKSKLESDEQDTMPTQKGTANRHRGKILLKL